MQKVIKKSEAAEYAKVNIKKKMDSEGLGVRELARMSENSAMTISRIVSNGKLPSVDCLLRIAKALGVTLDELFKKPRKSNLKKVS